MKKPCHIVPMDVKVGDHYEKRDVVMPGIYEYRTTAMRTKLYMGYDKPVYGPVIDYLGVKAPEWCEFTVYRWHEASKTKIPFSAIVYFREVVATTWVKGGKPGEKKVNDRWTRAPYQMTAKTAEAAALRAAFPDEFGGEPVAEEIEGHQNYEGSGDVIDVNDPLADALAELPADKRALADETIAASKLPKGQITALFIKHKKDVVAFLLDLAAQNDKASKAKPADVKPASDPKATAKSSAPPVQSEVVEAPNVDEIF